MKKWFWGILIFILTLLIIGLIYIWTSSEERPEGLSGPKADKLAQNIYEAVRKDAWDSVAYVGWSFKGVHTYLWDKQDNLVEVKWEEYTALLDPETVEGKVYQNDQIVKGSQARDLLQNAYSMYCNDGFWFYGFTKLHDPGTQLKYVEKEGENALLVTYTEGGVTPGDSYLWYTDEEGLPEKFEIWASILPLKGMDFTWENWDTLYNGALYAQDHKSEVLNVSIDNVISGPDLPSLGRDSSLFSDLKD